LILKQLFPNFAFQSNKNMVQKSSFTAFCLLLCFSFLYGQKTQKPISVNGGISATTVFYSAQGIKARKAPFTYILSGNVNVNLYGYNIPFSFVLSDRNSKFRQPFNQFGFSPKYKWATLHLGYRNIRFSPFVLNGHTIYGVGLELNPGKFRFGIIKGRFKRKVNLSRKVDEPLLDTSNTFTRKGYSVKLGYGTSSSYIDFIFLKVSDDTLSLANEFPDRRRAPKANAALGISSKLRISNQFRWEMDIAYSLFTNNTNFPAFEDQEIAFINHYAAPVNLSSEHFGAIQSSLTYKVSKHFDLALKYKRMDPNYKTMGVYYMQNDVQNISLNIGTTFWQSKVQIKTSLGRESNNLSHLRKLTTKRWIGSANLNFNLNKNFGLSANYSNYSINQGGDAVQIADSIKLYQTNSQLMINPRYLIFGKTFNHSIIFVYNSSSLNDKNPYTEDFSSFTLNNYMLNYNINHNASGLALSLGYNYALVEMKLGKSTNSGFSIGVSKNFFKNKLRLRFSQLINKSVQNELIQTVYSPSLSGSYKILKHHNLRFKLYYKSNHSVRSYHETTGDISYLFTF
jgi:hypothetical protein